MMTRCLTRINSARRILLVLWAGLLPFSGFGQEKPNLVIFDEDDAVGTGYYDASFGSRSGSSLLTLAGPGSDKLPIDNLHSFTGVNCGILRWKSAPGGNWQLFVSSPGWATRDASGYDSLVLFLNGPAGLDTSALPDLALESNTNAKTARVNLKKFLPDGLDQDTTTWQRAGIPLSAFQPFGGFSLSAFKDFWFSQGPPDDVQHTIWFDNARIIVQPDTTVPTAPRNLVVREGDRSIVLHWDPNPESTILGYNLYRATSQTGPFTRLNGSPIQSLGYADMDVASGATYHYFLLAVGGSSLEGPSSDTVTATPSPFASDSDFLDYVQHTAIDFFWYEANPANGLVRDRSQLYAASSVAAVGFGLTSICVGVDRGWIARTAARDRVLATLRTFWEGPQGTAASGTIGYKGFFYHFLDMNSATRTWDSELSSIDTGLLLAGILDARQYFDGTDSAETKIRGIADSIYNRVDWAWMRNGGSSLTMGWNPSSGFLPSRWLGYNEAMILYILGIGANAQAIPPTSWNAWTSTYSWQTHYSYSFVNFPPLFGHQYSHCWIDFRGIADAYMVAKGITYAENTRRATLAQRQYCIANPGGFPGYGANLWGLTACDGPLLPEYHNGYYPRGAPPGTGDDGTIAPTAPAGSMPFTPEVSLPALRFMYHEYKDSLWTAYGFCDAFNLKAGWWDQDVLGIDQGPIAIMIENYRSESVWKRFMEAPEIQRGLQLAGFTPVVSVSDASAGAPIVFSLFPNYPNPFNASTTIRYAVPSAGHVRLRVYNVLGQEVATLVDEIRQAGTHSVPFDGLLLASGIYFSKLEWGEKTAVAKLILMK